MNASRIIAPETTFLFNVTIEDNDIRLDTYISKKFTNYSRSFFKKLINNNLVSVNGKIVDKSSHSLKPNDEVFVKFPSKPEKEAFNPLVNQLNIEIVFEHSDFLIVNKPAGIIVHAANSRDTKITLVDWLLSKFNEISKVGLPERPGIVHRLDMDTSGLIIIPRNNYAHMTFGNMFKDRLIKKTYLAIVEGKLNNNSGSIEYPIMRHPNGYKMTCFINKLGLPIARNDIREAKTFYIVIKTFDKYSLVEAKPFTGRTHQIRVHLSKIGNPIIGDILYGKKSNLINRQALHASKLEFEYEGEKYNFETPLPVDMLKLV